MVTVRGIRADEYDDVGALLLAAYDAAGPFDEPYRLFLRDPEEWVEGATAVWVAADDDDRPIGVVAFVLPGDAEFEGMTPPPGDCGFRFLAVDPAAQGGGAGAALVDRCTDEARRRGCRRLVIHSMAFMTAAHALYDRRGFVRRPDLDVRFPSGLGIAFHHDLAPDAAEHFAPPGPAPEDAPWYEEAWSAKTPC